MNTMNTMNTIFIFDIDHTLIHTNLNKMNSITDLPNDKTYIRPYARKLLKFLIKKIQILLKISVIKKIITIKK